MNLKVSHFHCFPRESYSTSRTIYCQSLDRFSRAITRVNFTAAASRVHHVLVKLHRNSNAGNIAEEWRSSMAMMMFQHFLAH